MSREADPVGGSTAGLVQFFDRHRIGDGGLALRRIGDGQSNITLAAVRDDVEVILRRPPHGPLPPTAHDVVREAKLLKALVDKPVPVPEVLAICEDERVIGAPFFVMRKVEGHVIADRLHPDLDSCRAPRQLSELVVEVLAEIHAIDWRDAGLAWLGSPVGYLERQLRRFEGLWERNRLRPVPEVERVRAWLRENLPTSSPATIVHGDFRLGNMIVADDGRRIRIQAVLDWEMSTLGDPLADLGYLTALWLSPGDPELGRIERSAVTRRGGFASREELLAWYEARSGRTVDNIDWYQTLALWKAAIFTEGNHRRARRAAGREADVDLLGATVLRLAARAQEVGPERVRLAGT